MIMDFIVVGVLGGLVGLEISLQLSGVGKNSQDFFLDGTEVYTYVAQNNTKDVFWTKASGVIRCGQRTKGSSA
jgi:hypothetical protein